MATTIEEAKAFLLSAQDKTYKNWLAIAKRSWAEIKNRDSNGQIFSITDSNTRKKYRYPAWYSIFKIRQPLVLSRIGEPIGLDTTAQGNDPMGAAAALAIERLAVNLPKTFDYFEVLAACRDDFLATNFAQLRAYYERNEIKERVKEYLTFVPGKEQGSGEFLNEQGKPIETDDVFQDEAGQYYIETNKIVDVEDERVCLEPVLYKDIFVDPVRRWGRVKRLAMREWYSPKQFKEVFGASAYSSLVNSQTYKDALGDDAAKTSSIAVIEYWDLYDKEVLWFPENGDKLIEPVVYNQISEDDSSPYDDEISKLNGLFNLDKFFPVPPPLMMNYPTDEFWPVPEYIQLKDWFDDIHSIFSKMVIATRSIRNRLIYDGSIPGLKAALSELAESDTIGVNNLTQALAASGGTLSAVAQYIPVEEVINSLAQYYTALNQRLEQVYRLTATGDMMQGQTADNSGKTLGERQIEEKYSSSALYEPQRKMQEFVRDSYQLMVELAVKNFKDESLDRYIIPETFPDELKQYYPQCLQLLKTNLRRFRVDLETDSTIAINEQYDKAMRMELFNAMTNGLTQVATTAESQPELASANLHALKFLIQGFRQGKLFQEEISQAIDAVIKRMSEPRQPAPDYQMEQLKINRDQLVSNAQIEQMKIQSSERIKIAELGQDSQLAVLKLQADAQVTAIDNQLKQMQLQADGIEAQANMMLEYQKLSAQVSEAQNKLENDRAALMLEARKVMNDQQLAQYQIMLEQQTKPYELQLEAQRQQIDMAELELRRADQMLKAKDRESVDIHTTTDNVLQQRRLEIDAAKLQIEMAKPADVVSTAPPIHIHQAPAPKIEHATKIKRGPTKREVEITTTDKRG